MKTKVDVEITGGFRNAGIILETKKISLDEDFKFSGNIEFIPPMVDAVAVIKGSRNASYNVKITINGITMEKKGFITKANGRQVVDIKYKFSDFHL